MALLVAAIIDVLTHRIPNWLTFGLLLAAILVRGALAQPLGWSAVASAVASALFAAGIAFALHFILWRLKLEGAGDAKLMMGVGALLGYQLMLEMTAWRYVLLIPYAVVAITVMGRWGNFRAALRWTLQKFLGRDPGEQPPATQLPFGPLILASFPLALATAWLDYFAP